MKKKKGRGDTYKAILKDTEVNRWYDNVARGSIITADVYLRRLGNFCNGQSMTPAQFAAKSEKKLYNILLDYVSKLENEKKTGSYIKSIMKALKSWLVHNDKVLSKKIKIRGSDESPTLKDERVPTQEELKKIFLSGDKKARVACVLIANSGLRIETLGNYMGNEGLRIGDLPELQLKKKTVEFKKIPTMVVVGNELSKAGHRYFTFLSEEGCEYLKDYLEERMLNGEKLTKDSPILRPKTAAKPFISTTNVSDAIRGAIRKTSFSGRPYVLRSYFATQLMLAEAKGLTLRDYRTFWMGHKGDIEHTYTTHRGRQPTQVIENMRDAYKKSQDFLQTKAPETPKEEELKRMFRSELLKMSGFTEEEIVKGKLNELPEDKVREIIRDRLVGSKANPSGNHNCNGNNNHQKVISVDQIDRYLKMGWEFVTELQNNRAIVRYPS